ncbi:unnamed protein product, partial [Staurois parvus]
MDGWMAEQVQSQAGRVGNYGDGAVQSSGAENSRVTRQVSNSRGQAKQGSGQENTAGSGTIRVSNLQETGSQYRIQDK